jgi:hypothetical protein
MRNKLHTTLICLLLTACTQGPSGTSDDDGTATDTVSSEQPSGSEDADSPLAYLKEYGGKMSFQTDFFRVGAVQHTPEGAARQQNTKRSCAI